MLAIMCPILVGHQNLYVLDRLNVGAFANIGQIAVMGPEVSLY